MTSVVWEKCLSSLQQELSSQQFNTWIRPLTFDDSTDGHMEFRLLAPNKFILDWVKEKFLHRIKELVHDFFSLEQKQAPQVISVKVSVGKQTGFQTYAARNNVSSNAPSHSQTYSSKSTQLLKESIAQEPQNIPSASIKEEANISQSLSQEEFQASAIASPTMDSTASFGGITSNTLSGSHVSPFNHSSNNTGHYSGGTHNSEVNSQAYAQYEAQQENSAAKIESATGHEGGLKHRSSLNKAFTFESFVEGKSNQMGLAAAQQVVENPGGSYNPLFIYGGVGLGKTHLMHAVGNEMAKRNPNAKIVYLHSERFVADMVKALQLNAINDFKRYYRSVDALLIDDIQFFAGKDRSQEEFFHTFNALLEGNQQIILTCDRYPKVISNLEERLKSRFGWGLTIEVEPPELETRVAILLKRAEEINVELSYDAAFFIAQRIRSNVRELEGALKRVIANATFTQREITVELVREALKDLLALQDKQVSITNIQKVAGEYYKIKVADLLSKRRSRSVARPRQMAMALAKELTNHSLPEIGDAFGGRDHTTVLHACRKIRELCDVDTDIQQDMKNLQRILTT